MKKLGVIALLAVLATPSAFAADYWGFCISSTSPYGKTVYFSDLYKVKGGTYHVGVQNAFYDYLRARASDPNSIDPSGTICQVSYRSRAEAEAVMNEWAGNYRSDNIKVTFTPWVYRGD